MIRYLRKLYTRAEWSVAIRAKRSEEDCLLKNNKVQFKVIKNPWRYWCADPFLFEYGNKSYLFFEMFDKVKLKGVIGCSEVIQGIVSEPVVILNESYHLSYPNVFEINNSVYMVPETHQAGNIQIFEAINFPFEWRRADILIDNIVAVDTTFLTYKSNLWMFTLEEDVVHHKSSKLMMFYKEPNQETWKKHKANPIAEDQSTARPAGKVFEYKGMLIRPSQDCKEGYGRNLNFNSIESLSTQDYLEKLIMKITPDSINIEGNFIATGIHTYNASEKYEVIDLQSEQINLISIIPLICFYLSKICKKIKGKSLS